MEDVALKFFDGKEFILNGYATGWMNEGTTQYLSLRLNARWYTFTEDPHDGYRSMLDQVLQGKPDGADVVKIPAIRVRAEYVFTTGRNVIVLYEGTTEVAMIGTLTTDEYYPECILEFNIAAMSFNAWQYHT